MRNLITAASILLLCILGCSDSQKPAKQSQASPAASVSPAPTPEAIAITAEALYSAYDTNGVAADEKFKGRYLKVTGPVDSVGVDMLDDAPSVVFSTNKGHGILGVKCMFTEDDRPSLVNLRKGQSATVLGICEGKNRARGSAGLQS